MRLLLLLILCAAPSFGSIIYDDTVTDLPGSGYPFGLLEAGTSTVTGWLLLNNVMTASTDEDTLSVAPDAGLEIVSAEVQFEGIGTYSISPIQGITAVSSFFYDNVFTPATPIIGVVDLDLIGSSSNKCTGPGGTPPCTLVWDTYNITFTVDAIPAPAPEPSSLGLSIAGLAFCGLMFVRKRA
jgi:hypothetical protein